MKLGYPEEGDILKVKIRNIKTDGDAIARRSGPGHSDVFIDDDAHNIGETVYVEITGHCSSHYEAIVVEPPEDEEENSYYEKSRNERIEWEGTEQDIENTSDKSKKVFSEGDQTGSKNDLLGGHL